jgi:hypothetical protein
MPLTRDPRLSDMALRLPLPPEMDRYLREVRRILGFTRLGFIDFDVAALEFAAVEGLDSRIGSGVFASIRTIRKVPIHSPSKLTNNEYGTQTLRRIASISPSCEMSQTYDRTGSDYWA